MKYKIKINYKEFVWVFIIPFITTLVQFFLTDKKDILALNRINFKIWQIYTKDFFNDNIIHYFGNVLVILIGSITLFLLLSALRKEKMMKYYVILIVLIVPPLTYLADKYFTFKIRNSQYFLGSSAIASAIIGLIMFFFFGFIMQKSMNIERIYYYIVSIILFTYLWIYFFRIPISILYLILIAIALVFYKFSNYLINNNNREKILKLCIVTLLYLVLLHSSFPANIGNINVLNHYFGLIIGVLMGNLTYGKVKNKK